MTMHFVLRSAIFVGTLLASCLAVDGQTFHAIRESGPRASNLNFVILAEGYTAAEEARFTSDATDKLLDIIADESWSPFADELNAFTIFVASAESGSDDPTLGITKDTYFNSSFGVYGIQRLLGIPPYTPTNTNPAAGVGKVNTLLARFIPDYDVVILLVNSTTYGGSGGFPAISSVNVHSTEVVLHELGHSFARLTDEYVDAAAAPTYPPAEYPNATQVTDRALISWRKFINPATPVPTATAPDENVVGLFEGAHYRATGFYRPTHNNKMRALNRPWGPVNLRQFAARVHALNLKGAVTAPVISRHPVPAVVASGQPHVVDVEADGRGPLTFQWSLNGTFIPGATSRQHTISSVVSGTSGNYAVEVTNARGATTSVDAWVGIPESFPRPTISLHPVSRQGSAGGAVTFSAGATSSAPVSYQWRHNGVDIPGATESSLTLPSVQAFHAGEYAVVATNITGSVTSQSATLAVAAPAGSAARLKNLSTRALCQTGDDVLIPGFVIEGPGTKRMLIRGIGPTLAGFGVGGTLVDPQITLTRDGALHASNDNWGTNANAVEIAATAATVGAFPLVTGSADAALLLDLPAGHYTVVTSGKNAGTGVAMVELYDADSANGLPRLVNISNRGYVGTGDSIMIPGFVVSDEGARTFLIRAVGPTLSGFGVEGVLEDPRLTVFKRRPGTTIDDPILTNDNWDGSAGSTTTSSVAAQVGAFPLAAASADAAFVVTLQPGIYTVHASGVGNTTGVALVEVYLVP